MAMEYTQAYIVGPEDIAPAPLGLPPQGPDMPGTVPQGLVSTGAGVQTGQNIAAANLVIPPGGQYVQRYPEGYVQGAVPYIAGLRGRIRRLSHFPDALIEPTLGPVLETNKGYPFTYLRTVVKSYKPSQEFQTVFVNGKAVPPKKFKARAIGEINANVCS